MKRKMSKAGLDTFLGSGGDLPHAFILFFPEKTSKKIKQKATPMKEEEAASASTSTSATPRTPTEEVRPVSSPVFDFSGSFYFHFLQTKPH